MNHALRQHLERLSTDRWARRGVRTLLRAIWIGACVYCIGLGGHLLWGWPLRLNVLGALVLGIIGVAVGLLLRPKLSAAEAARRLDQRFHLDEQLATALEVAASRPPPGSIAARLVVQADHTAGLLERRISRRQSAPWSEIITAAAFGLVALGLSILLGIGKPDIPASTAPLPPLASAQDPAQQFPEEPPAGAQSQAQVPGESGQSQQGQTNIAGDSSANGDPRTLEALADALRDQGATRPAAEALDRGDVGGAAQELRELADQASQLSRDARNELADALREAAEQIEAHDPALADQVRESADGLNSGGQEAAEALDDLARAIEQSQNGQQSAQAQQQPGDQQGQSGQQGQGDQSAQQGQDGQQGQNGQAGQGDQQGQGASPGGAGNSTAGEQRQSSQSERLGVEGQPVPLEANGQGEVAAEPSDRPPSTTASTPGFTQGDASSGERVQAGADPLRVPLDERDVVQGYFTP